MKIRWLVIFEGEQRIVYARTAEGAKRTAEYAQRITKAPKTARRANRVRRLGVGPKQYRWHMYDRERLKLWRRYPLV
jgi:hypothetical protein